MRHHGAGRADVQRKRIEQLRRGKQKMLMAGWGGERVGGGGEGEGG